MNGYSYGAIQSSPDIRDYTLLASNVSDLPTTYINSPTKIKSQGSHSTCVAYTLSSLIEFHNLKETQIYTRFSTDFIYGCRFDSDYFGEGMSLRDGLKVIQKYGDVKYSLFPGNTNVPKAFSKVHQNFETLRLEAYPNRITTYYKIKSLDELKYALYHDGPVAASMRWYSESSVDKNGIYHYNLSNGYFGHAVLIVGWDENNLIVQNSWGITFGKKGLFYVPIKHMNEVFKELYGATDNITNIKTPSKTIGLCSPLINLILKVIQYLIN